jgi:hypothetical protein
MALVQNAKVVCASEELRRKPGEPIIIDDENIFTEERLNEADIHSYNSDGKGTVKPSFQFPAPRNSHTRGTNNDDLAKSRIPVDEPDGLDGFPEAHFIRDQHSFTFESKPDSFFLEWVKVH